MSLPHIVYSGIPQPFFTRRKYDSYQFEKDIQNILIGKLGGTMNKVSRTEINKKMKWLFTKISALL